MTNQRTVLASSVKLEIYHTVRFYLHLEKFFVQIREKEREKARESVGE